MVSTTETGIDLLGASLASLPEEILIANAAGEESKKELRRAPSESIPEEILDVALAEQRNHHPPTVPEEDEELSNLEAAVAAADKAGDAEAVEDEVSELQGLLAQAEADLVAERAAVAKSKAQLLSSQDRAESGSEGPEETTTPVGGIGKGTSKSSEDADVDALRKKLAKVEAALGAERLARGFLERELSGAVVAQSRSQEALQEAVMSKLDASYEKGEFKRELDAAREDMEVALMSRLDASYQLEELKGELAVANEKLEEVVLERLQASYANGALRRQVDVAKEELQEVIMSKLDASYKAQDLQEKLLSAEEALEEAIMQQLETSYEKGSLRSQLDAAKEHLERVLQERMQQSQRIHGLEAELTKVEQERAELSMQRLDASYLRWQLSAVQQPEGELQGASSKSLAPASGNDNEVSEKMGQIAAIDGNKITPASPATTAGACEGTSPSVDKREIEESKEKKVAPSPAQPRRQRSSSPARTSGSPAQPPSRRALGADAVIPAVRGQQQMRREAELRAQKETAAKAKAARLRDRLRARYQAVQRKPPVALRATPATAAKASPSSRRAAKVSTQEPTTSAAQPEAPRRQEAQADVSASSKLAADLLDTLLPNNLSARPASRPASVGGSFSLGCADATQLSHSQQPQQKPSKSPKDPLGHPSAVLRGVAGSMLQQRPDSSAASGRTAKLPTTASSQRR